MVQRTRRNLSDPRIRKIIRAQSTEWSNSVRNRHPNLPRQKKITPLLKVLLFLGLLAAVLAVIIYPGQTEFSSTGGDAFSGEPAAAGEGSITADEAMVPQRAEVPRGVTENEPTGATVAETPAEKASPPLTGRIQVEILNGCGVPGLADRLMKYLRERGIDVVSTGNYVNFDVLTTKILDRSDNRERVVKVAELIGLPTEHILLRKNQNLQLDATIVLGKDYKSLKFEKP